MMFTLYGWVFVLVLVASLLLSLTGVHLPARGQSMKALMHTQVASFGLLFGLMLGRTFHLPEWLGTQVVPLGLSLLTCLLANQLIKRVGCSIAEGVALSLYLLALAATFLLCNFFPVLEVHHTQVFFGDVVTIAGAELVVGLLGMSGLLAFLMANYRRFLNQSVEIELLGHQASRLGPHGGFDFFSLCVIIFSLYALGSLFTLSMLFIAPVLVHFQARTLREYIIWVLGISVVSGLAGLFLSLQFSRLSTVPTMVMLNGGLALVSIFLRKKH